MRITIEHSLALRFDDGSPVRAASGIAPFGDGWLFAQDDATHAAWQRPSGITAVRLFPPVEGHDVFSPEAGTKPLKPDLEATVPVPTDRGPAVLALGSGSSPRRRRAALVTLGPDGPEAAVADLAALYDAVGEVLAIPAAEVNLEGACVVGPVLRWFNRGNLAVGVPSGSVDVDLRLLLGLFGPGGDHDAAVAAVVATMGEPRLYDLGTVEGVGLTVSDAVTLPDGRILVSASAEDTPNAIDDGPVVGAALALIDDRTVVANAALPLFEGRVAKVEGLALRDVSATGAAVLAVVDDDDPAIPSAQHHLLVDWG